MAFAVVRRTREIGIRIAIGAREGSVIWMVLRETLALILVGALFGTAVAQVLSRYVENQLFGVHAWDPVTTTASILLLLTVTVAAGYLPARRASRIDPVIALRYE
jgi:ABC-type antimicrobial peptide transport system permease subunit